jgi:hypothetical protein
MRKKRRIPTRKPIAVREGELSRKKRKGKIKSLRGRVNEDF